MWQKERMNIAEKVVCRKERKEEKKERRKKRRKEGRKEEIFSIMFDTVI